MNTCKRLLNPLRRCNSPYQPGLTVDLRKLEQSVEEQLALWRRLPPALDALSRIAIWRRSEVKVAQDGARERVLVGAHAVGVGGGVGVWNGDEQRWT